jgi:hypothetical protein
MVEACIMHGGDEKCIHKFGQKILRGRDSLKDLDEDGGIISEFILEMQSGKLWIVFIQIRIGTNGRLS